MFGGKGYSFGFFDNDSESARMSQTNDYRLLLVLSYPIEVVLYEEEEKSDKLALVDSVQAIGKIKDM